MVWDERASEFDNTMKQRMGRIMHGLITDVDNVFGLVTVEVVEAGNVQQNVELSFSAFSYMGQTAASSSWFRYIPQIGSAVLIGYRPNGKPEIIGYTPLNYKQLSEFKDEGRFKEFRTLQPGEFDLRSAGGVGLYASARGEFITGGGPVQTTLDARTNEARSVAGVSMWTAGNDQMRFGTVKRNFEGPLISETAVPVVGSTYSEFSVALNSKVPLLKKVLFQLGDIFKFGALVPQVLDVDVNTGLPMRGRMQFYDATGVTNTAVIISEAGDVSISLSGLALAAGMKILGLVNRLFINFLQITIQAVTNLAIQAGVVITINAPQVIVGGGVQGLMQAGAIPLLVSHRHVVVPDPTTGILGAEPSVELVGLVGFQTITLRSS